MIPSATAFASSSSNSATVRVDKATSEFLIGPDWTLNIEICDTVNSNQWLAKDVVKAVKKRLQHKNPRVQLLALTLLETMVKNCGDFVHFQIAEKGILQEMIKIVKKKIDMHVREKVLVLLDSWQEAFGGQGGKYPQYYWAYEELRRTGVQFPHRSPEAAPIFTPPVARPPLQQAQTGYGMPSNSSTRLDEAMTSEIENLSLSNINSMRNALDLLFDMLQAVNPNDQMAVKDEVIVDLVERCRANQKKLMHMLTTTGDEELLGQGLELNDNLQTVLARHDAIASGSPLPTLATNLKPLSTEAHDPGHKPNEKESSPARSSTPSAPVVAARQQFEEEEEEEDDFSQLARRHSKMPSTTTQSTGTSEVLLRSSNSTTSFAEAASSPPSNALVLSDPPAPARTTKEQDMIDFLALTLSTSSSPQTPDTSAASTQQTMDQAPVPRTTQESPYTLQTYVVPWAQHQPPPQPAQLDSQPQPQTQYPRFSSAYPPPPWAATPGYYSNNQNPLATATYSYPSPRANITTPMHLEGTKPYGSVTHGDARVGQIPRDTATQVGHKPFIPSYRLFEDLNVLGSSDGRFTTATTSASLSGNSGQSMVGGRK